MTLHWCTLLCECSNFLATKNVYVLPHCPYSPDMAPVISSCFQEWNCSWKGVVCRMSRKFRNSHWPSYTRFQNVSSNGARNAGHIA
jgi:hypothetical protein